VSAASTPPRGRRSPAPPTLVGRARAELQTVRELARVRLASGLPIDDLRAHLDLADDLDRIRGIDPGMWARAAIEAEFGPALASEAAQDINPFHQQRTVRARGHRDSLPAHVTAEEADA
jgi:hypothetical protein